MTLFNSFIAGVVALGCLVSSQAASANHYHHIDEMALDIEIQSRELRQEVMLHFRHTPQYRHLISDADELARQASRLHTLAHHRGGLSAIRVAIERIDQLFHHIEDLVAEIEHNACYHRIGHVHGNTRHVRTLLKSIERDIHHLQNDLRALSSPPPVYRTHVRHGGPGHGLVQGYGQGGGIHYSTGGFSIRLGF